MSLRFLLPPLLLLTLSACGTPIFNADFDADAPGSPPSTNPPGPPPGDRIDILAAAPGNLEVVGGGINGNSLIYLFQPEVSQAYFVGRPLRGSAPKYWLAWNGRASDFDSRTPPLRFWFGSRSLGNGVIEIRDRHWVMDVDGEQLGRLVPQSDHTVLITIDRTTSSYSGSIFQRGERPIRFGPRALEFTPGISDRLRIGLTHDNTLRAEPGSYLLDDIFMSEEEPDMPGA